MSVAVEERELCSLLMGLRIGTAPVGNSAENPKKLKIELSGDIAFSLLRMNPMKGNRNITSKKYVHPPVHSHAAYSNLDGNNLNVH